MKKYLIFFLIIFGGMLFILAKNVQASNICVGPAQSEVVAAVNEAIPKSTVEVCAGNATWSNTLIISKEIILQGAGKNKTIISDATGLGETIPLIKVTSNSRITGFTFTNLNSGGAILVTATSANDITATPKAFRIDNCNLISTTGSKVVSIEVEPSAYGVVDHCDFYDASVRHVGLAQVTGMEAGRQLWAKPLTFGTEEAFYVEDCNFTASEKNRNVMDSRNGAKWVMRYNTIKDFYIEAHSGFFSGLRGTRSWEVYRNTFIGTLGTVWLASLRSGTGVVWGNRSSGKYGWNSIVGHHFSIDDSRAGQDPNGMCMWGDNCSSCLNDLASDNDEMDCQCHACAGFCMYDGNSGTEPDNPGYPCRDQIGRSGGETLMSTQDLYPAMEWNNLLNEMTNVNFQVNQAFTVPQHSATIKNGRDFYNDVVEGNEIDGFTYESVGFSYKPLVYPHPFITDCINYQTLCDNPNSITYRFWSNSKQGHFYTISKEEAYNIIANDPSWSYEGVAYNAFTTQEASTTPIYRFWSASKQHHFFTASEAEKDSIIANDHSWSYEGIAYYAYATEQLNSTPVYRFWSQQKQGHFFTTSLTEKNSIQTNDPSWSYEGIAWYVPTS